MARSRNYSVFSREGGREEVRGLGKFTRGGLVFMSSYLARRSLSLDFARVLC